MTPPAAATAAARHRAGAAPARPARRVSGPATAPRRQTPPPRRRPAAVPRPARRELPLGARGLEWLRGLPDHRLLDRLIGGRVWIVLIGTLLVGIVTLQLSLLKLNAGIGRAVEQSTVLEQSNAALDAEISQLSDPQRIVAQAQLQGFVTPPQGSPRFLSAGPGDATAALAVMRQPSQSAAATLAAATTATAAVDPTTPAAATTTPAAATGTATTPAATPATTPSTTGTTTPAAPGAPGATPAAPTQQTTSSTPAAAGGAAPPVGPQG